MRLKRSLLVALVIASFGTGATTAYAQPSASGSSNDDPIPTEFITIDDILVEGSIRAPSITFVRVDQRRRFERLLSLKKSFLPKIQAPAHTDAATSAALSP